MKQRNWRKKWDLGGASLFPCRFAQSNAKRLHRSIQPTQPFSIGPTVVTASKITSPPTCACVVCVWPAILARTRDVQCRRLGRLDQGKLGCTRSAVRARVLQSWPATTLQPFRRRRGWRRARGEEQVKVMGRWPRATHSTILLLSVHNVRRFLIYRSFPHQYILVVADWIDYWAIEPRSVPLAIATTSGLRGEARLRFRFKKEFDIVLLTISEFSPLLEGLN